ncbi:MAG: lytic murein transglycosylase [Pelagimonas sp.]
MRVSLGGLILSILPGLAMAEAPTTSLRPEARPEAQQSAPILSAPKTSLRPVLRPAVLAKPAVPPVSEATKARFRRWLTGFLARARSEGIQESTLDRALRSVAYDPEVIQRDSNQSEFTKTLWDYLDSAASDSRIENGQTALRTHAATLQRIEDTYQVDKEVVVAIWGLESAYGTFRGSKPVIQSMATLAFDGRRQKFFEAQLIAALKIIQKGDTEPRNMTGSWAGAMGHTQFMPTSFQTLAVDYTGDGRRDIWSDDPTDALASTANFLKSKGWTYGQPWGVEVHLPSGFDHAQASRKIQRMPSDWARRGVMGINGQPVPEYGTASILLPAGHSGPAFLVFGNFRVIERYNPADAYVIGVGHLSDRLVGGPAIQGTWPRGDRALTRSERKELQRRLTARGFNTRGVDGRIGPRSVQALRDYQKSQGLPQDGYASPGILQRLR